MELKIRREYKAAADEVEEKLHDYLLRYVKKDDTWRRWVAEGKKTREEYRQWKIGQIAIGERWEALRDNLANTYANADKVARSIVLGYMPEVYAINHNWATYEVEHGLGVDTSYTLYDAETVERLMRDDPQMLHDPGRAVAQQIAQGKAVRWNNQQIQSVMMQSILQGEAIPAIATRLAQTVGDRDRKAAVRNARTMTTAAQNGGRVDGYRRCEAMGIELEQQWLATLDSRTRHSHRLLDGESVKVGAKFSNGCRFPGDPQAAPAEIYNCFVGGTYVATDSEVHRVYRHEYNGELVTVKGASGVCFTCTPNHPILTMRGWVPAKLLNDGDNLLVAFVGNSHRSRWNPDINHAFARFDTAHKFIDVPCCERAGTLGVNFHGDIPTSDVEIIAEKRFLRSDGDACEFKKKDKLRLKDADSALMGGGTFGKHLRCIGTTTFGFVRRTCDALSFFWWHLRHPEIHGLRPVALLNACGVKPLGDYIARDVEFLGESLDGFSGVVFADDIVSVDIGSGSTHVYNLQSENGYYFINGSVSHRKGKSNGIGVIAHNCRCTLIANLKGYENDLSDLSLRRSNKMKEQTYSEWKHSHDITSNPILLPEEKAKAFHWSYIREYMTL